MANRISIIAQLSKFGNVRKLDLVEDKLEIHISAGKRPGPVFGVEFFGIIGSAYPEFTEVEKCNEDAGEYSITMYTPEKEITFTQGSLF